MNKLNMLDLVYCWPYCALAARYKDDSGDGDNDPFDFIDDIVDKWLPGAVVTKMPVTNKLDFTYSIEHEGKLLISFLGTEGKIDEAGWISNISPQIESDRFRDLGGHVDFIEAGEMAVKYFSHLIADYADSFILQGHSRGGARCVAAARWCERQMGLMPVCILPYCAPPVFTGKAADEYDKSGLGAVTYRVTMSHDPVDLLGRPFLKHVGTEVKMPDIITEAIRQHGIIGKLGYGHAYSSVFECLKQYCRDRRLKTELQWMKDTEWVAKV